MAFLLSPLWSFSQGQPTDSCRIFNYQASNGHAIYLDNIPGAPSPRFVYDSAGATIYVFNDSIAQLTGIVTHESQPNLQWQVNIWLINLYEYNDWIALGRGYKVEEAPVAVVDSNKQDWTFLELDDSRSILTGVPGTTLDGDTLYLSHRPSNLEFGFQVGTGANAKNGEDGLSGWFSYTGAYSGVGDVNVNIDCDQPEPECDVSIDTAIVICDSLSSSFTVELHVSGTGTYDISDPDFLTVQQGGAGIYTFGPYPDSISISFVANDINISPCGDETNSLTADCSLDTCIVGIDSLYTECINDSSFQVMVTFSGVGNNFSVFDNLGSPPLVGLMPGTYAYGSYLNSTDVWITVIDSNYVDCNDTQGPVSADCTPQCEAGIDTAYTQCLSDSTFELVVVVTGNPGTNDGFYLYCIGGGTADSLGGVFADTIAIGNYPNGSFVRVEVTDFNFQSCIASVDSLTFSPDSAGQACNNSTSGLQSAGISNFEAMTYSEEVEISWMSARKDPGTHYYIERKIGSGPFERISMMTPTEMDLFTHTYEYTDKALEPNTYYSYRIKQVRPDGIKTLSEVIQTVIRGESEFMLGQVYPNPSRGLTKVKLNALETHRLTCDFMDMRGSVVSKSIVNTLGGTQELTLPTQGLRPGMYLVRLARENGQSYIRKLIITE